jgi:hypothetical protein
MKSSFPKGGLTPPFILGNETTMKESFGSVTNLHLPKVEGHLFICMRDDDLPLSLSRN